MFQSCDRNVSPVFCWFFLKDKARTGIKATTIGTKDTTRTMAMDSKAMDMATMMPIMVMAMGATITVSDKCPQGRKQKLFFLVLLVVQKNSVPFSLVLQTRAIQAMGKLQDVEATRVATSHTDHT